MNVLDIKELREDLGKRIIDGVEKLGREVKVATVRVGENAGDISYEKAVKNNCAKLNITCDQIVLEEGENEKLIQTIKELNETHDGILMFRPLKDKKLEKEIQYIIAPEKDIDAMGMVNLGKVLAAEEDAYYPATARAVVEIVKYYNFDVKNAVIVNRSLVLGKPLFNMLIKENKTVTMCHSRTEDIKSFTKNADLVVTAIGKAKMFDDSYFTEDSYVVDVGVSLDENGKLSGDVNPEVNVKVLANSVGKITTRVLLLQMVEGALNRQ